MTGEWSEGCTPSIGAWIGNAWLTTTGASVVPGRART